MSVGWHVHGLRPRLLLVTLGIVGVTLVAGVTVFNIALRSSLSAEAERVALSRAEGVLGQVDEREGGVVLTSPPATPGVLNSGAWVLSGPRLIAGPETDPDLERAVRALAGAPEGFVTVRDPSTRLLVLPIDREGGRLGTVVGGVRLAPYERTAQLALAGSLALAVGILIVLGLVTWWSLGAALRPVGRMTESAERWSDREPERRFNLGTPHDEITRLGHTLDQLLDRVAASVRRERRLSAEIAHELRTPVSRIAAEAELALSELPPSGAEGQREVLGAIRSETRRISRTIDTLLATASSPAPGDPRGTSAIDHVVRDVVGQAAPRRGSEDPTIDTSAVVPLRVGVEAEVASGILRPLVENALTYGARRVSVEAYDGGSAVEIVITDDGPGVAPGEEDAIFEPGRRGQAGSAVDHDGAGLGLSLSRRLAEGVGGEVSAEASRSGGRFLVRLPRG